MDETQVIAKNNYTRQNRVGFFASIRGCIRFYLQIDYLHAEKRSISHDKFFELMNCLEYLASNFS